MGHSGPRPASRTRHHSSCVVARAGAPGRHRRRPPRIRCPPPLVANARLRPRHRPQQHRRRLRPAHGGRLARGTGGCGHVGERAGRTARRRSGCRGDPAGHAVRPARGNPRRLGLPPSRVGRRRAARRAGDAHRRARLSARPRLLGPPGDAVRLPRPGARRRRDRGAHRRRPRLRRAPGAHLPRARVDRGADGSPSRRSGTRRTARSSVPRASRRSPSPSTRAAR